MGRIKEALRIKIRIRRKSRRIKEALRIKIRIRRKPRRIKEVKSPENKDKNKKKT